MHIVRPIPKLMCGDYKLACEAFKSSYENYASTFDAYLLAQIPHMAALISSYRLNINIDVYTILYLLRTVDAEKKA